MSAWELDPDDLRTRIISLEGWRNQRDVADARADEQRKYLDERFTSLEKKINGVAWLIVGGFVTALVTYVLHLPIK